MRLAYASLPISLSRPSRFNRDVVSTMASSEKSWTEVLQDAGQSHISHHWNELNVEERHTLQEDLQRVDLERIDRLFRTSVGYSQPSGAFLPVKQVLSLSEMVADRERLRKLGLQMIAEGKVAIILLAGGQGTRLGSKKPKGCYDIGLPSHKSLFQLQAERIIRLQALAAQSIGAERLIQPMHWYIMTSDFTEEDTRTFFAENKYFGLESTQVTFFSQGSLPCLTIEGKLILESKCKLAWAPDGNGGIYRALQSSGCLEKMLREGVECIDCFSVDNALAKVCDPIFIGACREKNVECGARVLAKAYPEEKVGVFATRNDRLEVVEYSELPATEASAIDVETGMLKYNWSNICMHYFTPEFLAKVCDRLEQQGLYHVAKKNIPSVSGPVPGVKLELFIFDSFPLAERTLLVEVNREEEFSPVKNAPGSETDSPETARSSILSLHGRWIRQSGGIPEEDSVEVSPLLSYAGEGLDLLCSGQRFPRFTCLEP